MAPRSALYTLIAWTLGMGALAMSATVFEVSWNYSDSMPPGLWRRIKPFSPATDRGRAVRFCPPDTAVFRLAKARGYVPWGRCPGGYAPMLKTVVAVPGDWVSVGTDIRVNGSEAPHSSRLREDRQGREMPTPRGGEVRPGEVWAVSSYNVRSFDSRYAGPIPVDRITGVMQPLFLWEWIKWPW